MYFDGSDVGLSSSGSSDVDAFYLLDDGTLLLSFVGATTIPDVGAVDDSDIVRFTGTFGSNTSGTYEWYFDGSDVELTSNGEDVDAIGFAPDGRLLISTTGNPSVSGVSVTPMKTCWPSPVHLEAVTPVGHGPCTSMALMWGWVQVVVRM